MNFMSKIWVHLRFLIKFIPIRLLGISLNIYGLIPAVLCWWLFGFNNFLFVWVLISVFFLPIAIVLEDLKWNPLKFMLDDSRKKDDSTLSTDYENWLEGRQINFWTNWLWHIRNRIWNLLSWFNKPGGDEYIVKEIINTLELRDNPVVLADRQGYMENDNFAGLKWITKEGKEDWWTYTGVKISKLYSIFGIMKLYYKIGKALYYKYSKCIKLENKLWILFFRVIILLFMFKYTWKKDLWLTIKYHPNNETGTIHLKIQWEK